MGVTVTNLKEGDGTNKPNTGDKVIINYKGTIIEHDNKDGLVFDSTWDYDQPFKTEIGTGKVIKAWDEGILQLTVGQKALLVATSDFAYGSRGYPPMIPPNSTLKFEVELLRIIRRGEPDEG